jgi:ribosomal subunit interface protein
VRSGCPPDHALACLPDELIRTICRPTRRSELPSETASVRSRKENDVRIDVTARSSEIKESARRLAQEKCKKFERFFGGSMSVRVVLDKQRDTSRVEMIATTTRHTEVIKAEHEDLLAAIDIGVDKMERAISRWKDKLCSRGRKAKMERLSGGAEEGDHEDEGPTYQQVVEGM